MPSYNPNGTSLSFCRELPLYVSTNLIVVCLVTCASHIIDTLRPCVSPPSQVSVICDAHVTRQSSIKLVDTYTGNSRQNDNEVPLGL